MFVSEKVRNVLRDYRQQFAKKQVRWFDLKLSKVKNSLFQPSKVEYITLKKDVCDEVSLKMIPEDVISIVSHLHLQGSKSKTSDSIWHVLCVAPMSCGGCASNLPCMLLLAAS